MSEYFVVFTNLASLPAVIYYQYHKKYYYSLQILLVSLFSFIHHIKTSGLYSIDDSGLFSLLDGWYSYLTIYVFSIYLFLSNHAELKLELSLMQMILLSLTYMQIGVVIFLPVTVFLIFFITGIHYSHINKISLSNPFLYLTFLSCILDIACFFIGMKTEYNYFHGFHHVLSFTVPIFLDKAITVSPPSET